MISLSTLLVCLASRVASDSLASYRGSAGGGGGGGGGGSGDYNDYSGGSLEDTIPGTPGVDYPTLAAVPDTGFSCDGRVSLLVDQFVSLSVSHDSILIFLSSLYSLQDMLGIWKFKLVGF